ncbi:hypothetical protein CR51_00070 [Caballeronia megalochromosomata]|jgi:hypothetical protein|nr:hypothetical protein CR51_00070 [Caballeronia megalochromosomata]
MKFAYASPSSTAKAAWPVFGIVVGLLLLLLVYFDPMSGAMLSIALPLVLLLSRARRYRDFLDYRIVYLFGITVWSFDHCMGLFSLRNSADDLAHRCTEALAVYGYGVLLSSFAVLLVWRESVDVGTLIERAEPSDRRQGRMIVLVFSSMAYAAVTFTSGFEPAEMGSALSSFVLLSFAMVQVGFVIRNRRMAFIMTCICISGMFSAHAPNRTSLLVPLAISSLAIIAASKGSINWKLFSMRSAGLVIAMLFIMIFADWQKQLKTSFFTALFSDDSQQLSFFQTALQSNYLVRSDATVDYFSYLQFIIEHELYSPCSWLLQLLTSFVPRSVYPSKPVFDLSAILYDAHVIDAPLYFDFLFDRVADSGLYGIVFYNLGYLLLTRFVYRTYSRVHRLRPDGPECGLYLTALVTLFLVIRGPIIQIAWFYLFPLVGIVVRNFLASFAVAFSRGRRIRPDAGYREEARAAIERSEQTANRPHSTGGR